MYKLIKLTEEHYVIVDDSEIKEGDWCLMFDDYGNLFLGHKPQQYLGKQAGHHLNKGLNKITHSTRPFGGSATAISLQEVKELIGEVDVNSKAYSYAVDYRCPATNDQEYCKHDIISAYNHGYNQSLEDNKEKKYTEEDMLNCFIAGVDCEFGGSPSFDIWIKSLQPKTEWEVEWEEVDNRQSCTCQCHNNPNMVHFVACCNNGWIGEITKKLKLK